MKRFTLFAVALFSFSLSACAQPANGTQSSETALPPPQSVSVKEPVYANGTVEARIRDALKSLDARIQVESIQPAPMPGFRLVIAGGQVLLVSEDGRYLLQGDFLDLVSRKNISEDAMAKVRKEVLAKLPEADRIVFAPNGTPKHTVVVLTDVECGYCRKLHQDIAQYNKLGIRVEYLAYPRAGLASEDYRKMVAVWCAPDRKKALTDAKNGRPVPMRTCGSTPVDMHFHAGQRMGLTGTPMILNENGQQLGGYLPPDALLQRLDALAAESKKAG